MGCSWMTLPALLVALLSCTSWGRVVADVPFCNASQQAACGDKYVPFTWLCNEEIDCPDEQDEQCDEACHGDTSAFQCDNGKCIPGTWRCDGVGDCMDGSDEAECECAGGKVKCASTPQCIDLWVLCDNHSDCDDGSDESSCPESRCLEGQWQCRNKVCIMEDWQCNGINDCGDGSDEEACGSDVCSEGMLVCDDTTCVNNSLICNGEEDCEDGMDEPVTCGRNCSVDNGGCMQQCANVNWGVSCSCSAGWSLQSNAQGCEDVDECAIGLSPCNQLCNNTIGSFTCSCEQGFQLYSSTVCKVADDATLVLLTANEELLIVDVRTGASQALVPIKGVPAAVAYDLLRESYFWVDDKTNLQAYKIGSNKYTQLYPDVDGVNSISVDWLTGQLFWASSLQKKICAGLSDGRGYVTILEKSVVPEQLVVFPTQRYMFWVNPGQRGNTAIESAGMDGSDKRVLAVVPMEQPVGLTLDYITSRLYWISEYKESIETMNIDGSGRLSFPEALKKDQDPIGLGVFEGWFFWATGSQLLLASRNNLEEKEVLLNSSAISAFIVLHELQQPQSDASPCVPGACSHICLVSPAHARGYRCACPEGTFLLPSGKCENLKVMYASGKKITLLDIGFKRDNTKTLVQELSKDLKLMEVDWQRNLVYWTDTHGQLMRSSGLLGSVQVLPTGGAVCTAMADIGTGNIYWLSCDGKSIQLTRFLGMGTKKLYQAITTIQHAFLDWKRGSLYWIERSKPLQSMNFTGGDVRDVWNGSIPEGAQVFLDVKSNAILWNSAEFGIQSLSLSKSRVITLMKRWPHALAATYEPYMASVNETALVLWDRRTIGVFTTISEVNISKVIILNLDKVKGSESTCSIGNGGCTPDEICVSGLGGVITCLCPDDRLNCLEVLDPSVGGVDLSPTPYCPSRFIHCRNGKECISPEFMCDGDRDCADGSDEDDCLKFCNKRGMFRCLDGKKCFEERYQCDGVAQCSDGSDELDCWKPTEDCALRCDLKTRCIPRSWICDANPDCFDETDEQGCVRKECSSSKFQCANGQCISFSMHCDGDNDCEDHSDEKNCAVPKTQKCPSGELRCEKGGGCFLKEWLCDGEVDCEDGTDEKDCKLAVTACGDMQFVCANGNQCVPDFWRCDGTKDCMDASDEDGCAPAKCQSNRFQCSTFECIPAAMACNGISNCIDGSDEGEKCDFPCKEGCSQSCFKTPYGPRCGCQDGFRLNSDKKGCVDINECKELDLQPCSQTCLNKNGTFACMCHPGYLLEPDAKTCKVTGSEPLLLVAVQFDLILLGLRSLKEDIVASTEKNLMIFSIDYDLTEQKIFWMDLNAESIKWVTVDSKNKGTLVKGIKSDCIAVDWVGRNLYWTDGTVGAILATQLNVTWKGVPEYTVVIDDDLDQPRSIALQPLSGLMYWSEIGTVPQIEQAGMDGTNRKLLIKEKLGWPTGLALDLISWKIFWSDDKFHSVGSANLDGSDIKVVQMNKIQSPFSLTVFEDEVFWSEMKTRTVQRMDKYTGKNPRALIKRHGQPYGLKVMHEVLQPKASNPCLNFGCSHLCLLSPGLKGSCWCFLGMLLADDGKNCIAFKDSAFLLVAFPTLVTQVYLRKLPSEVRTSLPDHNNFPLVNVDAISSMDYIVQERALYFAVSKGDYIGVTKVRDKDLSWKKVLTVEETVISLAVDWMSSNIYWISTWKPYIQVAKLKGMYALTLISDGLYSPSSLALYPSTGVMCYADAGSADQKNAPKIECASMDGNKRRILWKKLKMPVGLVFAELGARLYWADGLRGVIETVLLDGSKYKMIRGGLRGLGLFTFGEGMLFWSTLVNGTTQLYYSKPDLSESYWAQVDQQIVDLRTYSKMTQQGTNDCSVINGECSQLCLPNPQGRLCMCSVGYHSFDDGLNCIEDVRCADGSQPCKDGERCISPGQVCDGSADCLDRSDEMNCKPAEKVELAPKKPPQLKPLRPVKLSTIPSLQLPTEALPDSSTVHPSLIATPPLQESTTTPADQKTEPPLNVGLGRNIKPKSCTPDTCNKRGSCVEQDGQVTCKCEPDYQGDFCEEEEMVPIAGKLIGGIFTVLLTIVAAGVLFLFLKKRKVLERTSSTASSTILTRQAMLEEDEHDVESLATTETFVNDAYDAQAIAEEELATPLQSK